MRLFNPLIVATVALGFLSGERARSQEGPPEKRAVALAAVRSAAAGRDMTSLKKHLAAAATLKGEAKFNVEIARLEELGDYLEKFWAAVDRGAKTLDGGQELTIGEQTVAFVEYENGQLVLRVQGQNREYSRQTLPAQIALTLARLVLKNDAPENKVFFGTFLLLDAKGDVELARGLWKEAAAAGIDIKHLLPELAAERPLPPVEIPKVTPLMRNLLAEKNWSLRVKGEKGWVRKPLDKLAEQDKEGRLVVRIPSDVKDGESLQIINKRQFNGDFGVQLILQNVKTGQTLGLFATDGQDAGYFVELPAGTMRIELSRQAGELKCLVAGKPRELKPLGKASPRMLGVIGATLPAGAELTIAALEFAGR